MKKNVTKICLAFVILALTVWFTTYPPTRMEAQTKKDSATKLAVDNPEIAILLHKLDAKGEELKALAEASNKTTTKTIVRTRYIKAKKITVYVRQDGIITEHNITNDNGFYILDLPKTKPPDYADTAYIVIDTCIRNPKPKTSWINGILSQH